MLVKKDSRIFDVSGIWPDKKAKGGYWTANMSNTAIDELFTVVGEEGDGYSLRLVPGAVNLRRVIEDRLRKDETFMRQVAKLLDSKPITGFCSSCGREYIATQEVDKLIKKTAIENFKRIIQKDTNITGELFEFIMSSVKSFYGTVEVDKLLMYYNAYPNWMTDEDGPCGWSTRDRQESCSCRNGEVKQEVIFV